jgi:hypothetical protein
MIRKGCWKKEVDFLPKLESTRASGNKLLVHNVFVFLDAEMTSSNLAHPVDSTFSRDYRLDVSGVESSNSNLCDLV